MRADDGGIYDRRCVVDVYLHLAEQICPHLLSRPIREPVVHGLPWAESLGKVTPRNARLRTVDNGVHE